MKIKFIIIHHTATDRDSTSFEAVKKYHVGKGWGDIGYNWFITPKKLHKGRPETHQGAHCRVDTMNFKSVGICLTGNFETEQPTEHQLKQLKQLVRRLQKKYVIPKKNILGHKEVKGASTACPGKNLLSFVKKLREEKYMGDSPTKLDICLKKHKKLVEEAGEKDKEINRLRKELEDVNEDLKREVSAAEERSKEEKKRWQEFKAKLGELLGCAYDEPVILSEIKRLVDVEDQLKKAREKLETAGDRMIEYEATIDRLRTALQGGSGNEKAEGEVKKMDIPEKFKSRKFLAMIGAVLAAVGTALTGQVEWSTALTTILIAVMGYVGIEGAIDYKTARPNSVKRE